MPTATAMDTTPVSRSAMIRRIRLWLIGPACCLAVAACDRGGSEEPKPPPATQAPPVRRTIPAPPKIATDDMEPAVATRFTQAMEALRAQPTSAEAWATLAAVCDVHELFSQAADCYRQALALDGADSRWPYLLAFTLTRMDTVSDEAVRLFKRATILDPRSAPAAFRLADALAGMGKLEEAKAAYLTALEIDPDLAVAHFGLAQVYLQTNQPDSAVEHLEKTIALAPDDAAARSALARAHLLTGNDEAAKEHSGLAATREPSLGFFDPIRAQVVAQGASSGIAHDNATKLLAAGGADDARNAMPWILALSRLRPGDPHVALWQGIAATRLGDHAAATAHFDRAVQFKEAMIAAAPDQDLTGAIAQFDRAHLEFLREHVEAVTVAGTTQQIAAGLEKLQSVLASAMASGDGSAARAAVRAHARALLSAGNAHLKLNNAQAAVELYSRAVELDPSYADAFYNLGIVMERTGQPAVAITFFEQAVAIDPDGPAALRLAALKAALETTP